VNPADAAAQSTWCRGLGAADIRLGSPTQAVPRAYGVPEYAASYSWDTFWIYDSRGLLVRTSRPGPAGDETLMSITVFAPSAFCEIALSDPRKISPRLCL